MTTATTKTEKTELTAKTVKKLAVDASATDNRLRGFQARRLPSGKLRFTYRFTLPGRQQQELALGMEPEVTAQEAYDRAVDAARLVAKGIDPQAVKKAEVAAAVEQAGNTVSALLDRYMEAKGNKLRSAKVIKQVFERAIKPVIGNKVIYELKKADLVTLRDSIPGRVAPDVYLRYLRSALLWQADRDEKFKAPKIKPQVSKEELERDRILNAEEVRDLWRALDEMTNVSDAFKRFVRACLLTAQRRTNVATMHTDELDADGWTIPKHKAKTKRAHLVHVTDALRAEIGEGSGFLFSNDGGKTPLGNFGDTKAKLDEAIAIIRKREGRKPMPSWVFHDLRRTARSMLSPLTTPDIAERVLAHKIPGQRGIYDRFEYRTEKADAFTKLAARIAGIVAPAPTPDNVVPLSRGPRAAATAA